MTWWDVAFIVMALILIYIAVNLVIIISDQIRLKEEIEILRERKYFKIL